MNKEKEISKIIKDLGVSPSCVGYHYIKEAIGLVMKDIMRVNKLTKSIYPTVASRFDTTPARVERCIRHAIETGWLKGSKERQDELFGYTVNDEKGKPTNNEFISTVADWLLMNQGEQDNGEKLYVD